ncbi:MAG: transglutaminase domain-containing protein, partial [Bacteroidales bacterium]|nr:transglutaminase domain-containing protein [Bacteroidales bacterium]
MKKIVYVLAALFLFACSADKNKIDSKYYKQVESDFNEVKKLASNRDDALFSVFNQNLSKEETRYLQFLYAYMPLSDLSDLSGDYFLKQVQTALEAKEYFSWGEIIPDDIFRHFVLPYRVNNEYPDTARQVFFRELKPRIENMNMYDAALEVNHWCHEKANYKATDRRTISPLDIVRSSFGRCGEESTFAVTALRAVGIPARQVYTPRWAHSDSNHAWVEVWIDGKWYFMGACEPEAQLNRGWFEAPAMRAMLVHTRVFGKLKNSENQMITNDKYSIINVIDTYIEPVDLIVKVIDENENLIQDAEISFGLYNYAQFYPIAVLTSDEKGECKMRTNHGSMLIYVQKDEKNAHSVFRVDEELETDTLILKLSDYQTKEYEEELYVEVPKERELKSPTSEDSINKIRLAQEDSIRNAYVESFPKDEEIEEFAQSISLNATEINEHIKMSWGNYDQIMEFIKIASEIDKNKCLKMLENLNEKDHRDARAVVLIDHFKNAENLNYEDDFFAKYVMNPRISTEKMKAYRSYFLSEFDADFIKSCQENPSLIKNYIEERISIDEEWNFYGLATSPIGVHEMKIADPHTRNIYFVALCRSFNIPARLNPVTTVPEYYFNENWLEIGFEKEEVIETIK